MTNLLTKTGEALYGPRWQRDLARALNVNERTMRRWAAGDSEPSDGVYDDLRDLVAARIKSLRKVARDL